MRTVPVILMLLPGLVVTGAEGKMEKKMAELRLTSPVFTVNGSIPAKYTCDGVNINPPLVIDKVPTTAKSLALIMDDPDAPMGTWVHWVIWNIAPANGMIQENSVPDGAVQGRNSWQQNRYGGPCPPSGSHRYHFRLFALDTVLTISAASDKGQLEKAMHGHAITETQYMGTYKRR